MNNFRSLYFADISRYPEKPEFYIRTFLYLYRRVTTTSVYPLKLFYIALFRIWSNRRGLEISPIDQIGGGLYLGHAFNITINPEAKIGKIAISIRGF